MMIIWFLRYGVKQTFFVILGDFLLFYHSLPPSNDPENQNVEKRWKKCLKILSFYRHMCNINVDHMIYGSWNTRCERQKFCHFAPSLPFQPPDNTESKNFKIEKNNWRYCHFTHLHHKWQSFDGIWSATDRIFCHSGPFFALLPPYGPRKSKLWKNEKIPEDIIILKT